MRLTSNYQSYGGTVRFRIPTTAYNVPPLIPSAVHSIQSRSPATAVWKLAWLTPTRCRLLLALLLLAGFFGHLAYLKYACRFDLTGDEAQYWEWSRRLDLSYYSKGPAVAYIIRASCAIFGDNPLAVRLPALLLAVGSSLCTYWLTRKLFSSEKLALGEVLLSHVMPIFAAGSLLMTIDPPFFFCWGLATCLAAIAVFDHKRWPWPFIGVVVGLGFLAKYAMLLWPITLLLFLAADAPSRGLLRLLGPWLSIFIALLFTTPVLLWNAHHNWGTLHHVAGHNLSKSGTLGSNIPDFLYGQLGVVGPVMCVLMAGAIVWTIIYCRPQRGRTLISPQCRQAQFLLLIGLPFLLLVGLASLRSKVQANWPAPAYFTLTILTAFFLSTRLKSLRAWKPWQPWFYSAILTGAAIVFLAHDLQPLLGLVDRAYVSIKHKPPATSFRRKDPTNKFSGFNGLAQRVATHLHSMPPGSIVLCDNYQLTAEMAFYLPDHPITYCVSAYVMNGRGITQYDMWADHALDQPELPGRNAIYLGKRLEPEVEHAFDHCRPLPDVQIPLGGGITRSFHLWRCDNFKGMHRATIQIDAAEPDTGP